VIDTWVLTPCHRPRLPDLIDSLDYLAHPPERTVVTTTLPDPVLDTDVDVAAVIVNPEPGINISRWWNRGLDWIADNRDARRYNVLLMESDVRIDAPTLAYLARVMRDEDCAMAGADRHHALRPGQLEIRRQLDLRDLTRRIPGICMLVRGELGLRFDPEFRWWYADDDFEWQHRQKGGTVLVGGTSIEHPDGHNLDDERTVYATEDRAKFAAKWGSPPW
jgi:hypothetical protein